MTFRKRYIHFEFLVMSFGLTNTLAVFMDLINMVFKTYLEMSVVVLIDCILVYPCTKKEYNKHLRIVLQTLRICKFSKCEDWLREVVFLGHVVSGDGTMVDPKKTDVVRNWPRPLSPLKIR